MYNFKFKCIFVLVFSSLLTVGTRTRASSIPSRTTKPLLKFINVVSISVGILLQNKKPKTYQKIIVKNDNFIKLHPIRSRIG